MWLAGSSAKESSADEPSELHCAAMQHERNCSHRHALRLWSNKAPPTLGPVKAVEKCAGNVRELIDLLRGGSVEDKAPDGASGRRKPLADLQRADHAGAEHHFERLQRAAIAHCSTCSPAKQLSPAAEPLPGRSPGPNPCAWPRRRSPWPPTTTQTRPVWSLPAVASRLTNRTRWTIRDELPGGERPGVSRFHSGQFGDILRQAQLRYR